MFKRQTLRRLLAAALGIVTLALGAGEITIAEASRGVDAAFRIVESLG